MSLHYRLHNKLAHFLALPSRLRINIEQLTRELWKISIGHYTTTVRRAHAEVGEKPF